MLNNVCVCAANVFSGRLESSLDEQWRRLDESAEVMAMAPDDEIVAELLALQSELVQQSAINRSRVAGVLALALQDMPAQAEAASTRRAQEAAIVAYQAVSRQGRMLTLFPAGSATSETYFDCSTC